MDELDYWKECLGESAGSCNLEVKDSQLQQLAEDVKAGHDYFGQAFYQPPASDYYGEKIKELEDKLKREESAEFCTNCKGKGRITEPCGTSHVSTSDCYKCNGVGKIY